MEKRKFSREFKIAAVKMVTERGVAIVQASHDLGVHATVLRKWVKDYIADAREMFPGKGQMRPEQLEIDRLRKELKAERDILKKAAAYFARDAI